MDATTALALYGCKMERNQEIAKASIFFVLQKLYKGRYLRSIKM